MDHFDWNRGLLIGSLLIVIGVTAVVAGRSSRERLLASGVVAQGIAVVFATGGSFFSRVELDLSAASLLLIFCLWGVWVIPGDHQPKPSPETSTPVDESQVPR